MAFIEARFPLTQRDLGAEGSDFYKLGKIRCISRVACTAYRIFREAERFEKSRRMARGGGSQMEHIIQVEDASLRGNAMKSTSREPVLPFEQSGFANYHAYCHYLAVCVERINRRSFNRRAIKCADCRSNNVIVAEIN